MTGRLSLLRARPDFARYWWGQALSQFGSRTGDVTLPLMVLTLTGSLWAAGLVSTVRLVTLNAARLPAGVLADRWDRRTVMVAVDVAKAAIWTAPAVLLLLGQAQLWMLVAVGVLDGLVSAIYNPAAGAALRRLVDDHELTPAVALNEARSYAAGMAGPIVGGALWAVAPWLPFLLDGVTFLACAWLTVRITTPLGGGAAATADGMLAGIRSGLRFVVRHRFLRTMTLWAALLNFATAGAFFGIVPLLESAGTSGTVIGAATAAVSAGALLGALAAPRLAGDRPYPVLLAAGVVAVLLTTAVAVRPDVTVTVACLALLSAVGPVLVVLLTARMYRIVPDEVMGRTQSAMLLVGSLLYPFGSVVVGAVWQAAGPSAAYALITCCLLGCAGLSLARPIRAELARAPAPAEPVPA
ncbi:MFS transporter [Micromonospora fluostatini]|uniref:MFS transporter n=1 Tax=Micromonospora sp. JCM 30529 TaxID=3421643 RepID=UPI003D18471B